MFERNDLLREKKMFTDEELIEMLKYDKNVSQLYHNTLIALNGGPSQITEIQNKMSQLFWNNPNEQKRISGRALRYQLDNLIARGIVYRKFFVRKNPFYELTSRYLMNLHKVYQLETGKQINPYCRAVLNHVHELDDLECDPNQNEMDISSKSNKNDAEKDIDIKRRIESNRFKHPDFKEYSNRSKKGKELIKIIKDHNIFTKLAYFKNKELYLSSLNESERLLEEDLIGDWNDFVKNGPDEEKDVRALLWDSDLFHILDMYKQSQKKYNCAKKLASEQKLNFYAILADSQISEGHILLHLNRLDEAKKEFKTTLNNKTISPILKARTLFRLGEIEVYQWDLDDAIKHFNQTIEICNELDESVINKKIQHIIADTLRKKGTALRLKQDYDFCKHCYEEAESIYDEWNLRGKVWLLHGWAEYQRAIGDYGGAINKYKEALDASKKILNINRVAHARIGLCETYRLMKSKIGNLDADTEKKVQINYKNAQKIYVRIESYWGFSQVIISKSLYELNNISSPQRERYDSLFDAQELCTELGLKGEIDLINRIIESKCQTDELNPLSLF